MLGRGVAATAIAHDCLKRYLVRPSLLSVPDILRGENARPPTAGGVVDSQAAESYAEPVPSPRRMAANRSLRSLEGGVDGRGSVRPRREREAAKPVGRLLACGTHARHLLPRLVLQDE